MRKPFPIGWRGKVKRYAVGAVCPARVGRTVCAVRVGGGGCPSKKIFKRVSKIFSAFAKPDTPIWYTVPVKRKRKK